MQFVIHRTQLQCRTHGVCMHACSEWTKCSWLRFWVEGVTSLHSYFCDPPPSKAVKMWYYIVARYNDLSLLYQNFSIAVCCSNFILYVITNIFMTSLIKKLLRTSMVHMVQCWMREEKKVFQSAICQVFFHAREEFSQVVKSTIIC